MNCGQDINYHSEGSTDKCFKQLNEKILEIFLYDCQTNKLEENGLATHSSLQEIPHITTSTATRGNS